MMTIYLGPQLLSGSSDSSLDCSRDTILHTRKYFAVSPELNRFVTVRNSVLADDGYYPLRLSRRKVGTVCSDFPLRLYVGVAIQYRTKSLYYKFLISKLHTIPYLQMSAISKTSHSFQNIFRRSIVYSRPVSSRV